MLSCEACERKILNAFRNLFWVLIVNRNNLEMSTRMEGGVGGKGHTLSLLFVFLLVGQSLLLYLSLSVPQPLPSKHWTIDLTLIVFLFCGLPLYHTQHLHIHTGQAGCNYFFLHSGSEQASRFFCLAACITACQIPQFDCSVSLFSKA